MLKEVIKRIIVIILGILISAIIWHINCNIFNNPLERCLIISTCLFFIVYTPFETYFSVRNIWYDRWPDLDLEGIIKKKVRIPLESKDKDKNITINIIKSHVLTESKKDTIIIINHGYSDTKQTLEYLYLPLAMQGYTILVYDARGTGESRKLGKRYHFQKRIEDYQKIIQWIKSHKKYHKYQIYSIGFSIGGIISISGSFNDLNVRKIIAISCISHYKKNLLRLNPIILFSYILRGISLFPDKEKAEMLSPYKIFKNQKEKLPKEEYKKLSERIYLIHAKNDRVIKFNNFKENCSILDLPEKNQLIFKKGGHTMKKNEVALVGSILRFLDD